MKLTLKPLNEQVMIITGASSGIGLATARMASRQGARLVLAARSGNDLDQLVEECGGREKRAVRVQADGYAPWSGDVDVPAPRGTERVTARGLEVQLEEAVAVSGEVVDARGDPVPGARVRAERPARRVIPVQVHSGLGG